MNLSRIVRLVSPRYCFLHFLHSIIYVRLVELQVICCFICLVSPCKSVRSSCIVNVRASETSMSGVAAESARGELGCCVSVL